MHVTFSTYLWCLVEAITRHGDGAVHSFHLAARNIHLGLDQKAACVATIPVPISEQADVLDGIPEAIGVQLQGIRESLHVRAYTPVRPAVKAVLEGADLIGPIEPLLRAVPHARRVLACHELCPCGREVQALRHLHVFTLFTQRGGSRHQHI
jgi:hypothetical protein